MKTIINPFTGLLDLTGPSIATLDSRYLRLDGGNQPSATLNFPSEFDDGNSGTADTIDWDVSNFHKSTLTGNCTYTFDAPPFATLLILRVVQDSTARTITWPAAVKWPGAIAPVLSQGSGDIDVFTFYFDGTNYNSIGISFDVS